MDELEQIRLVVIGFGTQDGSRFLSSSDLLDSAFVRRTLLLNSEGLLEGAVEVVLDDGKRDLERRRLAKLTDLGHEFYDAVRDPEVWKKVKDQLKNTIQDIDTVTLAVVVATAIAMKKGDS